MSRSSRSFRPSRLAPRFALADAVRSVGALVVVSSLASSTSAIAGDHDWWFPGGTPVSGDFSSTSNWADFDRPSTAPNASNVLRFIFATDAPFTAENDLQSGLSVGEIIYDNAATGTITGLPIRMERFAVPPEIEVRNGTLRIAADIAGNSTLFLRGDGVVRIDGTNQNSGALVVDGAEFQVSAGAQLGSLDARVEIVRGEFRAMDDLTAVIPFELRGGAIAVASATDVMRLTRPIEGSVFGSTVTKKGLGELRLEGSGAARTVKWRVDAGTLVAVEDALGADRLIVDHAGTVRFEGTNAVNTLGTIDGVLDVGSNGLVLRETSFVENVIGTGWIESDPADDGMSVTLANLEGFEGSYIARGAQFILPDWGRIADGAGVEVLGSGSFVVQDIDPVAFASLTGDGTFELRGDGGAPAVVTIGEGSAFSYFEGTLVGPENAELLIEGPTVLTDGAYDFDGRIHLVAGALETGGSTVIDDGVVRVDPGATWYTPTDDSASVRALEGAGTVSIGSGSILAIGVADGGGTFGGTIESVDFVPAAIRKVGAGTQVLDGDLSAFRGAFDVQAGTLRVRTDSTLGAMTIAVAEGATLTGRGEWTGDLFVNGTLAADSSTPPLRASGLTPFVNGGEVRAPMGATVVIERQTVTQGNGGALIADGGVIRFENDKPQRLKRGLVSSTDGGVVVVAANHLEFDDVATDARIEVRAGSTLFLDDHRSNDGPIIVDGNLRTLIESELDGGGRIELSSGARLVAEAPLLVGGDQTLAGEGRIIGQPVTIDGTIEPSGLRVGTELTLPSEATFRLALGAVPMDEVRGLVVDPPVLEGFDAFVELGGTLRVEVLPGPHAPAEGDRIMIVGDGLFDLPYAGTFDALDLDDISPLAWEIEYGEDRVELVVVAACLGDIDGDGMVGPADLAEVLGAWGPCAGDPCAADLNGDGEVTAQDLAIVLAEWGTCD